MIVSLLVAVLAMAQENTGSVAGVVIDVVTRRPVRNVEVSIAPGTPDQKAITDASGRFELDHIEAGRHIIAFRHRNYRAVNVLKTVIVPPGQVVVLTAELTPPGAISGRVLDEDGDPLDGCSVHLRMDGLPMSMFDRVRGLGMRGTAGAAAYRIFDLKPGIYVLVAICGVAVFEPRPLSRGPDPSPTKGYQTQFSEPITVTAGAERPGVDFRMRPMPVTHIAVTLAPGDNWRGRKDLGWQLIASDREMTAGTLGNWHPFDTSQGGFEIPKVFAGSYTLLVTARTDDPAILIGAAQPVTVGDKPVQTAVTLRPGLDLSGRAEIDEAPGARKLMPSQVGIQLMPEYAYLNPGVPPAKVEDDGSFTIKSAFPGPSRLHVNVQNAFLKAAWIGGEPVIAGLVDLSNGPRGDLRVVISTNMATLQGNAEPGLTVWVSPVGGTGFEYERRGQSDATGIFRIEGLAPGSYKIAVAEIGNSPQGPWQEISLAEGETKTIALK